MTLPVKVAVAVLGLSAASAAAWFVVAPRVTGPERAPRAAATGEAPAAEGAEPVICVGSDTILRGAAPNGRCAAGETTLNLDSEEVPDCDDCNPFDDGQRLQRQQRRDRLSQLEERVEKLERHALLTVVSKDGKPVMKVSPAGARFYNSIPAAVAAIGVSDAGGYFTGRSGTRDVEASIGASSTSVGIRTFEGPLVKLILAGEKGQYALRIPSLDGVIAGIGETRPGTGALIIGDRRGRLRTSLTVPSGGGMLGINGRSGHAILAIHPKATGGGMIAIGTAQGDPAVKMGNNYEKYGIVMTGPVLGLPLTMGSGLPGSYILGCAGGPLCGASEQ